MAMSRILYWRWLPVLLFIVISLECYSRAGGGGGDFSIDDDSGIGAIIELIALLIYLPFPLNIIVVGVIILLAILGQKKYKQSSDLNTIQKIEKGFMSDNRLQVMMAAIKGFNKIEFTEKVQSAFNQVQAAWMKKNLSPVRKFISDGVYRRFSVQLQMMNAMEQENIINHLQLIESKIVLIEKEGSYDVVHVQFQANISEKYVNKIFSGLDNSYNESFTEVWTFIRKSNCNTGVNLFASQKCPSCKAELSDSLGEVSKCESCGTYTNTGEFDWILCEIIQAEEFIDYYNHLGEQSQIIKGLDRYRNFVPNINLLEDKASNAYLQIRIAIALNEAKRIRRFSNDEFFEKISSHQHDPYLFNRIYIRDTALMNVFENDTHLFTAFSIQSKEQKVFINQNDTDNYDRTMIAHSAILVLTLNKNASLSAHNVMSHKCTKCAGELSDTTDIVCPYCGSIVNDDKRDWIVCGLFNYTEYRAFCEKLGQGILTAKKEKKISTPDLDMRDYALNNMLVIMMSDGQLSEQEKLFARDMSSKLGYNKKKIESLWEHAQAQQMSIMMPNDARKREKVYKIMKKTAEMDALISEKEKAILEDVRVKFGIREV